MKGRPVTMVDDDHRTAVTIDHHATPAAVTLTFEEQTTRVGRDDKMVDVGHAPDATPQAVRSVLLWRG